MVPVIDLPGGPEIAQEEEPWSDGHEDLLETWKATWIRLSDAHGAAESRKRMQHRILRAPVVLVPLVVAPLLAGGP